jgi:hypothetical protein
MPYWSVVFRLGLADVAVACDLLVRHFDGGIPRRTFVFYELIWVKRYKGKTGMIKVLRVAVLGFLVGAFALCLATQSAQALPITGGISFSGDVTAYATTDGSGPPDFDFTSAKSLVFGPTTVASGANGSFSGISAGTPVAMYSPLEINPPQLPIPATSPLWQVTVGSTTFAFTLSTLTEPLDTVDAMELTGSGIVSDGDPADSVTGQWVATFNSLGETFSWSASSASGTPITPPGVPDSSNTLMLLGLGLTMLGGFGRFRK